MRVVLELEKKLLKKAMELSLQTKKNKVVKLGLQALIEKMTKEQILKLSGSDKRFQAGRRNR